MSSDSDLEDSVLDIRVKYRKLHVAVVNNSGLLQLWASFLFALLTVFWNSAFQVVTEYVPKSLDNRLLRDLAHSLSDHYLGKWIPKPLIVDLLLTLMLVITFVRFFCFTPRAVSLVILKRYLLLQGVIFLLRGPALYMTMLPPTLTNPQDCLFDSSGSFVLDTLLVSLRQKVTCTDLFFSGHSAMMLLWTLFMTAHTTPETFNSKGLYYIFMFMIWIITTITLALIPLTKFHYSIDVYIGILLPVLLQRLYYDILSTLSLLEETSSTKLSWSQNLVLWFETGYRELRLQG